MDSFLIDMLLEIFLRLPLKSIVRFHCLSKLWSSLLHRPYFTELFLTMSSARPRLLFAIKQKGESCFYSCPQTQNSYEKSSLVVAADFHIKFPGFTCSYDSGLIFLSDRLMGIGNKTPPMICNPNTGQYVILPKESFLQSYIGFDPIDKQFKVLSMATRSSEDGNDHKILTLGTGKHMWRKIQCPPSHGPLFRHICINGVLYYLSTEKDGMYRHRPHSVVCFDIRSEKFKLIDGDYKECFHGFSPKLVNYKGKLGLIFRNLDEEDAKELRLWVLEDVEKQVWSNYVYTLPKFEVCDPLSVYVVGVTAMGQIVLSTKHISKKPFYVFYFNPQDKTLHTVEIQGFEGLEVGHWVSTYVEHVEDLHASDAKLFGSSNSVPSVKNKTTTSG